MHDMKEFTQEVAAEAAEATTLRKAGGNGSNQYTKGKKSKCDDVTIANSKRGNDPDYLAQKIARDRPDVLAKMQAGAYRSVRAAAIDAGVLPQKTRVEQALTLWKKMDAAERQAFLQLVNEGRP